MSELLHIGEKTPCSTIVKHLLKTGLTDLPVILQILSANPGKLFAELHPVAQDSLQYCTEISTHCVFETLTRDATILHTTPIERLTRSDVYHIVTYAKKRLAGYTQRRTAYADHFSSLPTVKNSYPSHKVFNTDAAEELISQIENSYPKQWRKHYNFPYLQPSQGPPTDIPSQSGTENNDLTPYGRIMVLRKFLTAFDHSL